MARKAKIKCPRCGISKHVEEDHHDCPTCNCGTILYCRKCGCEFGENGEEF